MAEITRRSFVTALFGVAAAAPLLARIEGLALSSGDLSPVLDMPTTPGTYGAVLQEARRIFDAAYFDLAGPYSLGGECLRVGNVHQAGDSAHVLTSQLNVGFQASSADGPILGHIHPDHALPSAMRCLALSAVEGGLGHFGGLILPRAVEYAGRSGPLRMCVAYDVMVDAYVVRFDVLGARTAHAEAIAVSRKVAQTKAAIKQRLTMHGQAMAPINPFWTRA